MIVIIDYGVGNIKNVQHALDRLGASSLVSADPELVRTAPMVILPGVGAFPDAMIRLTRTGMADAIRDRALTNKLTVGICLGLQLLCQTSDEGQLMEGLGVLKGHVRKIKDSPKLPHMGWNKLKLHQKIDLVNNLPKDGHGYFVHSYQVTDWDPGDLVASTTYGATIPAVLKKDMIIGIQFHPEKSGDLGHQLLGNIIQTYRKECGL